ncbi:unnamed protein product, partial [Ectocarpus sp. 8 AP-2014]
QPPAARDSHAQPPTRRWDRGREERGSEGGWKKRTRQQQAGGQELVHRKTHRHDFFGWEALACRRRAAEGGRPFPRRRRCRASHQQRRGDNHHHR